MHTAKECNTRRRQGAHVHAHSLGVSVSPYQNNLDVFRTTSSLNIGLDRGQMPVYRWQVKKGMSESTCIALKIIEIHKPCHDDNVGTHSVALKRCLLKPYLNYKYH